MWDAKRCPVSRRQTERRTCTASGAVQCAVEFLSGAIRSNDSQDYIVLAYVVMAYVVMAYIHSNDSQDYVALACGPVLRMDSSVHCASSSASLPWWWWW